MAKIGTGILKDFIDGEYIHDNDLDQLVEIIRVANNDTDDKATYAKTTVDAFTARVNELEFVGNERDVRVRETFTATEGQTLFTLTKGTYKLASSLLDVNIGSSIFYEGNGLTETSSSSFTLTTPVTAGTKVTATYYLANAPLGSNHGATHKLGGADEISITEMAGYTALTTSITDQVSAAQTTLQTNISTIANDLEVVRRKEIANLTLMLDATSRVSAPDYLGSTGGISINMSVDELSKRSTNALTVGTTNIMLNDIIDIVVNGEYTIYDDVSLERITVTAIDVPNKIVTVSAPITKAYKVNASFVKSMILEEIINGFNITGWVQPDGQTNATTLTTIDSSYNGQTYAYSQAANDDSIAIMDNGDIFASYTTFDGYTNNHIKLAKYISGGILSTASYATINTGNPTNANKHHAVFNLGGVYIGWFYTSGEAITNFYEITCFFRIMNTQTGEYKDNEITIPISEFLGYLSFALSDDKKTLYVARATNSTLNNNYVSLWTINIFPDMSISTSLDTSLANVGGGYSVNFSTFKLVIAKGNLCLYTGYNTNSASSYVNIHVFYRPLSSFKGSWYYVPLVNAGLNASTYYGSSSLDVLVDINGVIWIAYSDMASGVLKYMYSTSSTPHAFSAPQTVTGSTGYGVAMSETKNDILMFMSSGATSIATLSYVGVSKTSKAISITSTDLAATHFGELIGLHARNAGFRVAKNKNLSLSTGYFLTYVTDGEIFYAKFNNTSSKYYPLLENDMRFTLTDIKELTLYISKESNSLTSVNGYLNGIAATKTETQTEVMLDWVLPSIAATAEIRLEFTRNTTGNAKMFNKIVGGKSNV